MAHEIKASQYKHLLQISETLLLSLNIMKPYRNLYWNPPGLKPYQDWINQEHETLRFISHHLWVSSRRFLHFISRRSLQWSNYNKCPNVILSYCVWQKSLNQGHLIQKKLILWGQWVDEETDTRSLFINSRRRIRIAEKLFFAFFFQFPRASFHFQSINFLYFALILIAVSPIPCFHESAIMRY